MARKSLVQRTEVDEALKSHNCQASAKHRVSPGDRRLKVYVARTHDHYCADCGLKIIEDDIAKLQKLAQELRSSK